jgi:succinyl-CoA synthetase beta subunit
MKTITVLIPAYNEEAVLPQLFARLKDLQKTIKKYRLEILFINDGSSDDTLTMIQREAKKNSSIAYVNLSRNFGKEAGMLAGFDYAKGDAVVIIELLAHTGGGVEIESQDTAAFFRRDITNENFDALADELADYLDIADKAFSLQDIIENAYRCFIYNDCLLLEINPLILTKDGKLIAGDAKITVDDAAAFRHLDWQFEDNSTEHNFVILNREGEIATIANGAGLAMATVDAVAASGLEPANFLDIGGTATSDKILDCFRQITTLDNIKVIIINIFGGIVRCDEVARAIIDAQRQIPDLPKLAIRLSGNRESEARQLLAQYDLPLFDSLEAILEDIS